MAYPALNLLSLKNTPIFQQLQLEEALLRADDRNWCVINEGSPPAIVMGISGQPELLIDKSRLKHHPVPVIRRFSGGGTVFIDEQTYFITFICNSQEMNVGQYPDKVLQWSAGFYGKVFPSLNFRLAENDYVLGDRKFGGNAQYLRKDRWLHHSSLLWDFNPSNMEYLLFPPKTPKYREQRGHTDFLCRLKDHYSIESGKEVFKLNLFKALENHFKVEEVSLDIAELALMKVHRKATTLVEI